ncbi:NAD(P)-dependent dehydrogenase (short-subunit alcohol dehydrogenase family) [Herbihabitans rhizosphaerae]|uniref:NAD(P)-dependent dehydrogenase (Short-subunit alcohol dehydrogenase family) n=1 Tax=Herbihabitans rhizosphaerae TaxID=1872711 RepID=A0A4Q7KK25_9PSEU|nr:SDR family oxidoreductase [Herbihabitans rhizosphaerae]RZS36805.1 NAD(P)-dependent dehydrogenase (short-subunit alcohol dehydrogenase family) [Herbihabitans rhizosphaerae]
MATKKIALITGANKGIGKEIARQLGEHGFTVLVGARDEGRGRAAVDNLVAGGADVRLAKLDVTDAESVADAAKEIERDHGRLDVLVNNVGILSAGESPVVGATLEVLWQTYATNVGGVLTVTNEMLPLLRKADRARIVNVSSALGSLTVLSDPAGVAASKPFAAYNSSKAALNALTIMLANELRDEGITVNAMDPGYTATDMNDHQGIRTVAEAATSAVRLSTMDNPPTAEFHSDEGIVPW